MAITFSSIWDLEIFSSPKIDRIAGPPSLKQNFYLALNQGTITGIKRGICDKDVQIVQPSWQKSFRHKNILPSLLRNWTKIFFSIQV